MVQWWVRICTDGRFVGTMCRCDGAIGRCDGCIAGSNGLRVRW